MNKNLSTEVAGAIADALRETASQPPRDTSQSASPPTPDSPKPSQVAGVLRFVAGLLSNSALSRLFDAGRPEDAVLRGTLVGLASGVQAVTEAGSSGVARKEGRPFGVIATVSAYVLGGVAVALLLRGLRSGSRSQGSLENAVELPGQVVEDPPHDLPRAKDASVPDSGHRHEERVGPGGGEPD